MNICINRHAELWLKRHPRVSQWLWFVVLWLVGLTGALLLALPVKLAIKL